MPKKSAPIVSGFTTVGRIVGAFGLKGQLKVEALTNIPERFDVGNTVYLAGEPKKILDSRVHKNRFLLKIEGVSKLEQAQSLQWQELSVPDEERPKLDEDEFMREDLIGLAVVDQHGQSLGAIEEVLAYPAHDILVVNGRMIPAVKEFVSEINLEKQVVTVRLIEGL